MSSIALPLAVSSDRAGASFHLGYRPALDGLRGIAVCCVFAFHLSHMLFGDRPLFGVGGLPNGFLGVDIFFVLSGFLITALLLAEHAKTNALSLRRFYARRALRLLPALILFLLVTALLTWFTQPPRRVNEVFASILYTLLYATNWVCALRIAPIADEIHHAWSLAIEEHFYLIWPLLLLVMLKLKIPRRWVIVIVLFAVVAICGHRIWLVSNGSGIIRVYEGSDTRADSLLIGCAAAMLFSWGMIPTGVGFKRLLGGLCFLAVIVIELFMTGHIPSGLIENAGFTLFATAVAVLLLQTVHEPPRILLRLLELRILVWLGRISYGLYLWQILGISLASYVPMHGGGKMLISALLTVVFASASFYLIERPFLRLKRYFEPPPVEGIGMVKSAPRPLRIADAV